MYGKEEIQEMIEQKAIANEAFLKHPTILKSTAKIDKQIFEELRELGFDREEALKLLIAHIHASK